MPIAEGSRNDFDLFMNRCKKIGCEDVETHVPMEIRADIEAMDVEVAKGMVELKALLGSEK